MQKLMCLSAALACCLASANSASAQFRDRDDDRIHGRDSGRFDGRNSGRFDGRNSGRFRDSVDNVVDNLFDTRANRHRARYDFGKRAHLPNLVADLYDEANSVCWEMHRNYQYNRGFKTTYAEMYEIRKAARHIEELVRENYYLRRNSDDHIARDLHQIDEWFHHVEGDVRNWRPESRRRSSRGGDLNYRMEQFEQTLHHLMEDYGEKSRIARDDHHGHDHR